MSLIWIGYTTRYREGGAELERAARTLARTRGAARPNGTVRLEAVETKAAFFDAMCGIAARGERLSELHFVGHGGMYGPMFGTRAHPEQLSPHEWRTLELPFADDGEAFFHACRSARHFAPFFARTKGVPAHGYYWYTTFSRHPTYFRWDGPRRRADNPLYLFGCPGRRSHGLSGSLRKYLGVARAETLRRFEPAEVGHEASYDPVAGLYDEAFADIRVREDEWRWITSHLPPCRPRVLDVGCGNGALLTALEGRIAEGVGVDVSAEMIARAKIRAAAHPHLSFAPIDGPSLPFTDGRFDVVISLMSFRYLDWDPMMAEMRRVLAPGGRILIVDMADKPAGLRDVPRLLRDKAKVWRARRRWREADRALHRLVSDSRWSTMLHENPMRAEHEYRWYLESRFPGREVEVLDVGGRARTLAFDSGPIDEGRRAAARAHPSVSDARGEPA